MVTVTIEVTDDMMRDQDLDPSDIKAQLDNMVRDALAEYDKARQHASEGVRAARSYVASRYEGSTVYRSEEQREAKAEQVYTRCRIARLLHSAPKKVTED
jgi:hypothetical protein